MYSVYMIRNRLNDKCYIGITKHDYLYRFKEHIYEANYNKSGRVICKAIRKYGYENFESILLEKVEKLSVAAEKEKYYIDKYRTYIGFDDSKGYNMTLGGEGRSVYFVSPETRKRMSLSQKGENHSFYGKHLSDEHKLHCSIAKLGIKKSEEARRKMSESRKRPVLKLDKKTLEIIAEYESVEDAQLINNVHHISDVCNKKRKTAGGFHWKFKNKEEI